MENKDYGELFCEAVDTIVKQRLESVSFDSTILCTIVDDSLRDSGTYTVTNNGGITKFDAYTSDTSLRNNNNVYVQIPGGDWNQQKIILAKKTDTNKEPYVYKKPFSSLVDITGNLISSNINSNETGLIANAEDDEYGAVTLWSYNVDGSKALRKEEGEAFASYTRLGIQADFQSWLNPFYPLVNTNEDMTDEELEDYSLARYVVEGDYGLRLRIITESEAISKDTEEKTSVYDLYLNCEDMNGNPYDFASFFSQEKVFNISTIGKIIKMELQFYQTKNSFKDRDGLEIPFKDFLGHYIKPNLYVKDVYISLGYDVEEFDQEMIQIYTLNSTTYARTADPLTKNHKKIQLRWIHKQEDGSFKSIALTDNLNYRIQWYRYELGNSSADNYSGVYWKFLSSQETEGANTSNYDVQDEDWKLYNKTCDDGYRREPSFLTSWCIPDVTLQEEQIKAILFYGDKIYRSNILTCTNEDEVVSKPTVDAVQALSINCKDNTYGNYRIYNQGNSLIDAAQAQIQREWIPYFKSSNEKEDTAPTELIEAESIEWIIPTKKTMIVIDKSFYGGEDSNKIEVSEDADSRLHIKRYGSGPKGNVFENGRNHQLYRIRSYYSQTYSDNTIQCKIVKDKITYTAVKELTFGVAGTTGTDCTFILDFDDGVTAVTDDSSKKVTVTARLYDYENNEIEDFLTSGNRTIKWGWKTLDGKLHFVANEKQATAEIKRSSTDWEKDNYSNYNILQATLQGWGDFELTAYLPIPIRSEDTYAYISGTTQVIYNSDGEILDYFKNPYILYQNDATLKSNLTWEIVNSIQEETNANYTPKLKQDTKTKNWYLEPLSFYVEDSCEKICVKAKTDEGKVIWSQPILILQNRYPSAMVNKWDGSLNIGESDPGTILAPRLVAGKKDKKTNTFSGVMLGDWESVKETSEGSITDRQTGLYGFDHGEQSYAFRQDGTAFIGKSGTGRIKFNGTQGLIESEGFNAGQGMQINLQTSLLEAKKQNEIVFSLSQNDPYFVINNIPDSDSDDLSKRIQKTLMQVGDNSYFLQSANFKDAGLESEGTYLDLSNGSLTTNDGTFNGNIYIYYSGTSNKYWWDKVENTERKVSLNSILDEINSNINSLSKQLGYIQTLQKQMELQINNLNNTTDFLSAWIWLGEGGTFKRDPETGKVNYTPTTTINFGNLDYHLAISNEGIRLQGKNKNRLYGGDSNFTCSKNFIVGNTTEGGGNLTVNGNITFTGSLTGKVYAVLA